MNNCCCACEVKPKKLLLHKQQRQWPIGSCPSAFDLRLPFSMSLPQNRMQRCAMDCADEAKDLIPAGAKEGDAVVEKAMAQVSEAL